MSAREASEGPTGRVPAEDGGVPCPACGAAAVKDGVCARCGYAQGEANRCPHCQAVARLEKKGPGAWVCAVCGGPRLPGGLGAEAAAKALVEEKDARTAATKGRGGAWLWGILAAFATLVVALAWPAALVAKLVLFALALGPTLLALRSGSRVGAATTRADEAHERALLAAAQALAAAHEKGITAAELATRLELPEARADALLTELAVHERTRVDVGEDAEVRYSVTGDALVRVAGEEGLESESESESESEEEEAKRATSEGRR